MNDLNNRILEYSRKIFPEVVKYRRNIHSNPELSFNEYQTAKYIRNILNEHRIEFKEIANTGTIGYLRNGLVKESGNNEIKNKERWIALRADIDALPVTEETGLEFSSLNKGVMHACGHDMHTAMLLGATIILNKFKDELKVNVKLIFQPGEEKLPGGASVMIENGCLIEPEVEAIFGQHVYPEENVGVISVSNGAIMGSADEIYITIKGKSTHAAQPHIGNDSVLAASHLIVYLQSIITKTRNPINSGVLSITSIHGGTATNIFPDKIELMGTLRSFDEDWRNKIHKKIVEDTHNICKLFGCTSEVNIVSGYPPVINNNRTTDKIKKISQELLGAENVHEFEPKMWGEDFSFYLQKVPGTFWFVGAKPNTLNEMPPLHNSRFAPDEEAIIYGMAMMASVALNYFKI